MQSKLDISCSKDFYYEIVLRDFNFKIPSWENALSGGDI